MSPRIDPSAQKKIWLSASYESNGSVCKMKATGGMVLFSKFSIFTANFFGSHFLVWGHSVQKDRQFDILCDKIDL